MAIHVPRPSYDWLYIPQDHAWIASFLAARDAALKGTGYCRTVFLGDSILAGKLASQMQMVGGNSYAALVRAAILGGGPVFYDYFPVTDSNVGQNPYNGSPSWVLNDTAHGVLANTGFCGSLRMSGSLTTNTTTLNGGVSVGATSIVVNSATGIAVGHQLRLDSGVGACETTTVTSIAGAPTLAVTALQYNHANGAAVSDAGLVFTSPEAATELQPIYYNPFGNNTNTITLKLNGGADQVVTTSAQSLQGGYKLSGGVWAGLTSGRHVVEWTAESATNAACLDGVIVYPTGAAASSGFGFANVALSGSNGADWVRSFQYGTTNGILDRYLLWAGMGPTGTLAAFGAPSAADLAIIAFSINDCGNALVRTGSNAATIGDTSPAQLAYALARIVNALRRNVPACTIVFMVQCNAPPDTSDLTSGNFLNAASHPAFAAAVQRVAMAKNCAVVNIDAKWGGTPVGQGFLNGATSHPNTAGHADMADSVKKALRLA